jgi:YfiR/HmsC-like
MNVRSLTCSPNRDTLVGRIMISESLSLRTACLALVLFAFAAAPLQPAEAAGPSEYEVKAAFLYNFARFVEWPLDAPGVDGTFVITVLGRDPFGSALDDTLRGKKIDDKRVVVRRALRPEDVGRSHIVFISDSEKDRLPAILKSLDTAPVLTVGDMDQFAERGGVIRFKVDQDRIRLEINVAAAQRSRLRISSQLLKLARIVEPGMGS